MTATSLYTDITLSGSSDNSATASNGTWHGGYGKWICMHIMRQGVSSGDRTLSSNP